MKEAISPIKNELLLFLQLQNALLNGVLNDKPGYSAGKKTGLPCRLQGGAAKRKLGGMANGGLKLLCGPD
jgi:hypothetical protein